MDRIIGTNPEKQSNVPNNLGNSITSATGAVPGAGW